MFSSQLLFLLQNKTQKQRTDKKLSDQNTPALQYFIETLFRFKFVLLLFYAFITCCLVGEKVYEFMVHDLHLKKASHIYQICNYCIKIIVKIYTLENMH